MFAHSGEFFNDTNCSEPIADVGTVQMQCLCIAEDVSNKARSIFVVEGPNASSCMALLQYPKHLASKQGK